MKTTKQLFETNNKKLLTAIMKKDEPVLCDSFSDAKDENYDKPLKDVKWKNTIVKNRVKIVLLEMM